MQTAASSFKSASPPVAATLPPPSPRELLPVGLFEDLTLLCLEGGVVLEGDALPFDFLDLFPMGEGFVTGRVGTLNSDSSLATFLFRLSLGPVAAVSLESLAHCLASVTVRGDLLCPSSSVDLCPLSDLVLTGGGSGVTGGGVGVDRFCSRDRRLDPLMLDAGVFNAVPVGFLPFIDDAVGCESPLSFLTGCVSAAVDGEELMFDIPPLRVLLP